jgi:cell division topological specificity factor
VIAKHMAIDRDKVVVKLDRGSGVSTLEIDIEMPASMTKPKPVIGVPAKMAR